MIARSSSGAASTALPWGVAWRLAFGQIIAWGILYYAFTVVVGPMQLATGWSRTFLNSGLSLGLLAWGAGALPVGVWLQRHGGCALMTVASALGGFALMVMGAIPDPAVYLGAWVLLGVAMAGLLYEPAFAVVTRAFGSHYRRGIALITLVGGLASTVFIPLAQWAVDLVGWQHALIALGAFQLAVGVPLHALGVPHVAVQPLPHASNPTRSERLRVWWVGFRRDLLDTRFLGLALWFTAHAAAFTGLIFQLVPVFQALGVETRTILQTIALIGPLQVLGRLLLTWLGGSFSTLRVGQWAMTALAFSVLILLVMPPQPLWLAAFAVLYGAGNGVMTILRGTAIAELFGLERYAELNGALAAPSVLAKAAAPLALAGIWSATGEPKRVFAAVLTVIAVGAAGLMLVCRAKRGNTSEDETEPGGRAEGFALETAARAGQRERRNRKTKGGWGSRACGPPAIPPRRPRRPV